MDLEYSKILVVGEDKGAKQRKMKYKHKIEKKMNTEMLCQGKKPGNFFGHFPLNLKVSLMCDI